MIVVPVILAVGTLMLPKVLCDNAKCNRARKKTLHHLITNKVGLCHNTFYGISPLGANCRGVPRTLIANVGQLPDVTKVAVG